MSEYTACRVTDGNALFPDTIIIDHRNREVIFRKSRIIGRREVKIPFRSLGSVTIVKHVLFCDIVLESSGGKNIVANGFSRDDADSISRELSNI